MLLFNVAEDFDLFGAKLPPPSKQFSGATFDQARSAHVRKDKSFHAQKIQARRRRNFQRRLVRRFEHLDADWAVELPANRACNPGHDAHCAGRQRRFVRAFAVCDDLAVGGG